MAWANTGTGAAVTGIGALSTLSLAYSGAITLGNLGICAISYANGSAFAAPTVTDQLGNTWTLRATLDNAPSTDLATYIYSTIFSDAGTPTVTADFGVNPNGITMAVTEYSFTAGTLSFGTVGTGIGNNSPFGITTPATTLPIAGVSSALVLAVVQWNQYNSGTFTAGTGFTLREASYYLLGGTNSASLGLEDWMNATPGDSPVTPTMSNNSGGGTPFLMSAFVITSSGDETGPSFTVSPSSTANAQSVVYTLTGSDTSWLTGTTFGISGVTGASITSQSCNSGTQVGTVTVLFDNTHTGTITFTDSADAATGTGTVTLAAPGAPVSPTCTPGNTQNVLHWTAPSTGGLVATYNVYRGTSPGGESGTPIITGLTSATYTDTGLTNGQIYYYTIKAVNGTATGSASSEVSGTPQTGPSFAIAPTSSANAQSVVYTLTGTDTSWLSGTTFGISGVTGASITAQSVNVGAQTANVTVLLDNTHIGTLSFTDSADAASSTSTVTLATPGAPVTPSCSAGNTQNILNWAAPTSGGLAATYNVYRGTTPGGESGTAIATGISALTYTDTGLTNGQIYYYTIKAVNGTGISVASTEVSGTPNVPPAGSGQVMLMMN